MSPQFAPVPITQTASPSPVCVTAPPALSAEVDPSVSRPLQPPSAVQQLVARAQTGDTTAFAQLYDLYAKKIHSYLRYHLNGRIDAAEDLAADVFVKALEKLHTYQFSGVPFSAWLYRIAHNHLIDYLRAQSKKQGVSLDECSQVNDPSAEQALSKTLTHQEIAGALHGLTAEQRQVIQLRFLEDRSIAYTARAMAKNEDAIKQLQVRALRNMRRSLAMA